MKTATLQRFTCRRATPRKVQMRPNSVAAFQHSQWLGKVTCYFSAFSVQLRSLLEALDVLRRQPEREEL
jgi:hypothetical protein